MSKCYDRCLKCNGAKDRKPINFKPCTCKLDFACVCSRLLYPFAVIAAVVLSICLLPVCIALLPLMLIVAWVMWLFKKDIECSILLAVIAWPWFFIELLKTSAQFSYYYHSPGCSCGYSMS